MPGLGTLDHSLLPNEKSLPIPNSILAVRLLPMMETVLQRKDTLSEILIMIDSDTLAFSSCLFTSFP